jgi:hypothetical protein
MTEKDLPLGVQAFVATIRMFGGDVQIDYDRQHILIHFDKHEDKERFYSWAAEVMDVEDVTFH